MGLKVKVLLMSIGLAVGLSVVLVTALSIVTYSMFYRSFARSKQVLADTIAMGIDARDHATFRSADQLKDPTWRRYFEMLNGVRASDPEITYLYTLYLDESSGELCYGIESGKIEANTVWIESDLFSLALTDGGGQHTSIEYNQKTYQDRLFLVESGKQVALEVKVGSQGRDVQLAGRSLLVIERFDPLQVRTSSGLLTMENRLDESLTELSVPWQTGTISLQLTLSEKGEPLSLPGAPLVDDEGTLRSLKAIMHGGEPHLAETLREDAYGTRLAAYSAIKDGQGKPVGLVAVEVYDNEIRQFRMRLLQVAGIFFLFIAGATFVLARMFSGYLLTPITRLLHGVRKVGAGDLKAEVVVDRKDEFGELANGFNLMTRAISMHTDHLEDLVRTRTAALEQEQEKSERLLLNVLPQPVAERLKHGEEVIVDRFEEVTVLFADLVGFTVLASKASPVRIVRMLNTLFHRFDELTERYGLEKIKTIGDAYMVAGGLNDPSSGVRSVLRMALDMRARVKEVGEEEGVPLDLRIGVSTGPVVAGVIGTKKFIYDLWGDTVNTASRMESHGVTGAIQVSETVFERAREGFILEPRGEIEVKGKGRMRTWFLLGETASDASSTSPSA